MQTLPRALLALVLGCVPFAAAAQTSPADYLALGAAVDGALGPNAELVPPPNGAALPPPELPPVWYVRQPFDQQPFFATRPLPGPCFKKIGSLLVPC